MRKGRDFYLRFWVLGLLLGLLAACQSPGRKKLAQKVDLTESKLKADIEMLSSDSFGGRPTDSPLSKLTENYICQRFQDLGMKANRQPFRFPGTTDFPYLAYNLWAFINNRADSTIVITAHFDHFGNGDGEAFYSYDINNTGLHPGADDNASGVAMLLELARQLKTSSLKRYNYVFIALGAHEVGLYGSKAICKSKLLEKYKVKLILNLDMVGRLHPESKTLRFSYCEGHPELKIFGSQATNDSLSIQFDDEFRSQNDYEVFCKAGFPCISLTTGIHQDYNRKSDTADKINYAGMERIVNFILSFL